MIKVLSTAVGAAALIAASVPANAAPTTFDFTVGAQGFLGNPMTCDAAAVTAGACSITGPGEATLQGWVVRNDGSGIRTANNLFQRQDAGLGNRGIGIKRGQNDTELVELEIDNRLANEFMSISFGAAFSWELVSITLSRFDTVNSGNDDLDAVLFYGSNGVVPGDPNTWTALTPTTDVLAVPSGGVGGIVRFDFDPGLVFDHIFVATGSGFGIADPTGADDFLLASVVGNADVPEPATLALLGLGLVGLGAARRRRRVA